MTLLNRVRVLALGVTAINGGGVAYGLMSKEENLEVKKEKTIWDKWGEGITLENTSSTHNCDGPDAIDPVF